MYFLKHSQESFMAVEGPLAGVQYRHGSAYEVVPLEYLDRFEKPKKEAVKTNAVNTSEK